MKHAKRILAVLLTLVLALSLAMPAMADDPPPPLATHITAEWNGTVLLWNLTPRITPDTVKITVHFDDGSTRVQDNWDKEDVWYGKATGIEGGLDWKFDSETCVMTITYADLYLWQAYAAANGLPLSPNRLYVERAFRDTLPKATIQFPENYLEIFAESKKPLAALELGKAATGKEPYSVFTFTPPKDGNYTFKSTASVFVIDKDFKEFGFGEEGELKGGQLYYIFARTYINSSECPTATIEEVREPSFFELALDVIGFIFVLPIAAFVFPPFPGLLIFAIPVLPFILLFGAGESVFNWIKGLF